MDLIELYVDTLLKMNLIEPDEATGEFRRIRIAGCWLQDDHILFRFEIGCGVSGPVCQYVVLKDGQLIPRTDHGWFIPGDVLFNTYKEAKTWSNIKVIKAA